jgi:hypothetical protein
MVSFFLRADPDVAAGTYSRNKLARIFLRSAVSGNSCVAAGTPKEVCVCVPLGIFLYGWSAKVSR